ncbi:MAG: sulfatase [Saprospiraceae bacterium]|nr:sulfatase [Saprospiraceae bacterium]
MHRYVFTLIFLASFIACQNEKSERLGPPNIIYIMSDDHANAAVSLYGSKMIETTNIDRIGREGIQFTNSFVTNSICAPSRAVLLTGKYSHLNGLRDNLDRFDGSQVTLPKLLQAAGYFTAMIGKWHLKSEPTGFDHFEVLIGQGPYYNPVMIRDGDTIEHIGYTSDIITDLTLQTLETRDTSKPFCILYHHKAPHRNWMPHPQHFDMYADEDLPLPPTFYDDYRTRSSAAAEQDMRIDDMFLSSDLKLQPGSYVQETGTGGAGNPNHDAEKNWANEYGRLTPEQKTAWDSHYDKVSEDFQAANLTGKALLEWKYQRYMKDYLRCVKSVDDNIGRVLDYLDAHGLAENTIVIYTSDQGFYLGEHGWYDKRFMYEESLRMPLVMRFPHRIEPGQIIDRIVLNLDFAPTLLDYAGVDIPDDFQGRSLRVLAESDGPVDDWRTSMYYHYYEYPHGWHNVKRHEGVRGERYKLMHYYNDIDAWELFDLQDDPTEINNQIDDPQMEGKIVELKQEMARLKQKYQVPLDELVR